MKIAVASMGTVPEAWVGVRFGMCSQFLVFDLDTMEYTVVSVPPHLESPERVSLAAIRVVVRQDEHEVAHELPVHCGQRRHGSRRLDASKRITDEMPEHVRAELRQSGAPDRDKSRLG